MYNNRLVTQLINKVLLDGKKSLAERIVYGAFDIVEEKSGQDPLSRLQEGYGQRRAPRWRSSPSASAAPPTRCPMEVNSRRATTLAIRWIVDFSAQAQGAHHGSSASPPRSWMPPRTPALP